MLLLLQLLPLVWADCPVIDCEDSLSVGECAKRNGESVIINEYGCTKDTTCLLSEFSDWFDSQTEVLECVDYDEEEDEDDGDVNCGTRNTSEMLAKDGEDYVLHPKRCSSDADCLLQSGQTSSCSCGLDGYSYCQPEWGSEVFDDFWEYCDDSDGKVPYDFYSYYEQLYQYYHYFVLAPDCARNIFHELDGLDEKPDNSLALVLALSLTLLV